MLSAMQCYIARLHLTTVYSALSMDSSLSAAMSERSEKAKAGERRFKMISTRKQKQLEDCKLSALEQRMYAWTCSNIVPEAIVFSPDIWRKSKQSSDSDYL